MSRVGRSARGGGQYALEISIPRVIYIRVDRIPRWLSYVVASTASAVSTWLMSSR